MNILFLSDDFPPKSFGGAGIVAFEQARALALRGHTVSVITTTQDAKEAGVLEYEGLTVYRLYANYHERWRAYFSLYNPQVISKVKKIVSEGVFDIVHAHNVHYFLSYYSLVLAKKYSRGVCLTTHDVMSVHCGKLFPNKRVVDGKTVFDYRISPWTQLRQFGFHYNPLRNVCIRQILNAIDKIFVVSTALATALSENDIKNVTVLHNGIDALKFIVDEKSVREFKEKYGLVGKKVILFGGRISRAKGGDVALAILASITKSLPNACLLIAGKKDEYVSGLLLQAKGLGLEKNVVCTGWLDRSLMPVAYQASDVVLTLSLYIDPFPTVNLEAMASGKPVIGTCYGGTPEAVIDGETGYVVDPADTVAFSQKVITLLLDQSLASRFGQNGKARVLNQFSLEAQAIALEKHYATIVTHK